MGATKIEFRLRMVIMTIILTLGFWAPWLGLSQMGPRIPFLLWIALELSRHGLVTFSVGLPLAIVLATLTAAKGMVFRVWGAAYLGPATVIHGKMRGDALVASGPYRYVRNPLYIGLWAMTAALAFLMPPTGAIFVLIAVPVFLLRLTLGEEAFLAGEIGQPYRDYLRTVPRLVPRIRSTLPPSAGKPQWFRAVFAEITSIGVFLGFASFLGTCNLRLTEKIILVCFGISLVVRALLPKTE